MNAAARRIGRFPIPQRMYDARVSLYDRVAAFMLAVLVLLALVVGCMLVAWLGSMVLSAPRSAVAVRYQQVDGGTSSGQVAAEMDLDSPSTQDIARESDANSPEFAETLKTVVDSAALRQADLDDALVNENEPVRRRAGGRQIGSGREPGRGDGAGRPGLPPHLRWEIRFDEGATLRTYARWLDCFHIKLAVVGNGRSTLVSNLSAAQPTVETADNASLADTLYMTWKRGSPLRQSDVELLTKSGVQVAGPVVQFYPRDLEELLLRLEHEFAGRDAGAVRKTTFSVRQVDGGFEFVVTAQTSL